MSLATTVRVPRALQLLTAASSAGARRRRDEVHRPCDVGGRQRLAVRPEEIAAQVERPREPVARHVPARGQRVALVRLHRPLVERHQDVEVERPHAVLGGRAGRRADRAWRSSSSSPRAGRRRACRRARALPAGAARRGTRRWLARGASGLILRMGDRSSRRPARVRLDAAPPPRSLARPRPRPRPRPRRRPVCARRRPPAGCERHGLHLSRPGGAPVRHARGSHPRPLRRRPGERRQPGARLDAGRRRARLGRGRRPSDAEIAWARETALGFAPPPADDSDGAERGGDARYDVYVCDLGAPGLGELAATVADPPGSGFSYIVVDNDYAPAEVAPLTTTGLDQLRISVAHELFHACRSARAAGACPAWLAEATAVWMEGEVAPPDVDREIYRVALGGAGTEQPYWRTGGLHEYGAWWLVAELERDASGLRSAPARAGAGARRRRSGRAPPARARGRWPPRAGRLLRAIRADRARRSARRAGAARAPHGTAARGRQGRPARRACGRSRCGCGGCRPAPAR